MAAPTQVRHPLRAVARTVFAIVAAGAAMAPLVYEAATEHDVAQAGGWAATGLGIAGAITRVLALPVVDDFLARFVPWLASQPGGTGDNLP